MPAEPLRLGLKLDLGGARALAPPLTVSSLVRNRWHCFRFVFLFFLLKNGNLSFLQKVALQDPPQTRGGGPDQERSLEARRRPSRRRFRSPVCGRRPDALGEPGGVGGSLVLRYLPKCGGGGFFAQKQGASPNQGGVRFWFLLNIVRNKGTHQI